ncbi:MAG: succinate dehydrogenase flavoprotein subunit [Legionellales bacterium]|nr:succinate dehydrogenase flavoprotein subunit [Legionellales bacterium]
MQNYEKRNYDAIVVGGGGAGLRAATELAQAGLNVVVVSKVFPTRSHTVSAQGGINAALGNYGKDQWQWHMYDTVMGSDFLGDQDAIEFMCKEASECIIELEHMGLPFSRNADGTIYQRAFGGQTLDYGGELAHRTCCAQDRTGHAMLHTLYQKNVSSNTQFLNEWFALDLVVDAKGAVAGITAVEMITGDHYFLQAPATVLATGGGGQIFHSSTNANICTGDGMAMVNRCDFGLQDMEMWQFHPTGLHGTGILISEGTRGEGGFLVNSEGERYMARYAPHLKDLSCRDVVARCSMTEIREGRGCGPDKDHVLLQLSHLDPKVFDEKLPGITEIAMTYKGVDPRKEPIPVVPTCHYAMGGIPANYHGQVIAHNQLIDNQPVPGLFAIGECANVSVHGANRLGANSLLDLVVMGRACGRYIINHFSELSAHAAMPSDDDINLGFSRVTQLMQRKKGNCVADLRREMKHVMQSDFGVFREASAMTDGLKKISKIRDATAKIAIQDHSRVFNTELFEALELQNLAEVAHATAVGAATRMESRGAHSRVDYPERDDKHWQKHIVVDRSGTVAFRAVNMSPKHTKPILIKEREH